MYHNLRKSFLTLLLLLFVASVLLAADKAAKLSFDEMVSKYFDALGTREARTTAKSRVAQGTVQFNTLVTGNMHLDGKAIYLSSGPKLKCVFQFTSPQYPGEQFTFDGQDVGVAKTDQQARSMLGDFLINEPEILQEGLWGGELSTAWPLLDTKASGAKLKMEGLKKLGGRRLYVLDYTPKRRNNGGELEISIGFEPETFRHVLTEYRLSAAPFDSEQSTGISTVVTTVDEQFSGFHSVDGLTLPTQWEIHIHKDPGVSRAFAWMVVFTSIKDNL